MFLLPIKSPLFAASLFVVTATAFSGAATNSHADDLPGAVLALGLKKAHLHHHDHDGVSVRGEFADGQPVEVDVDSDGQVHEVKSESHAGFKASDVAILIPEAVRSQPTYPADGTFYRVELQHADRIEIEGLTGKGLEFEAEYRPDGQVLEMKIDD